MFLPISLVMMGGWLIDRESLHDTLKNILTVPVSMPQLLGAKLFLTGILSVLLGVYSVGVTLLTGSAFHLPGLTLKVALGGGTQIVLASLTTYLVCMPLILIFGQKRGIILGVPFWHFSWGIACCFLKAVPFPVYIPFQRL